MADQTKAEAGHRRLTHAEPAPANRGADTTIVYLHGFLSSATSMKGRFFRERFEAVAHVRCHAIDFNPTPIDFETMTTTGQINRLRQYVLDRDLDHMALIGSSFGGLIALHYAHRFGGVARMCLLAPAVVWLSGGLEEEELRRWKEAGAAPLFHPAFGREIPIRYDLQRDGLRYMQPVPPAAPTLIMHGRQDRTVPIAHGQAYAADYPDHVRLVEVDADHDLNALLDEIWDYANPFLLGVDGQGQQ